MTMEIDLTTLTKDERRNLEHQLGIGVGVEGIVTKAIPGKPILVLVVGMTQSGPVADLDSKLTAASNQHMLASILLSHIIDFGNDNLTDDATSRLIKAGRRILASLDQQ